MISLLSSIRKGLTPTRATAADAPASGGTEAPASVQGELDEVVLEPLQALETPRFTAPAPPADASQASSAPMGAAPASSSAPACATPSEAVRFGLDGFPNEPFIVSVDVVPPAAVAEPSASPAPVETSTPPAAAGKPSAPLAVGVESSAPPALGVEASAPPAAGVEASAPPAVAVEASAPPAVVPAPSAQPAVVPAAARPVASTPAPARLSGDALRSEVQSMESAWRRRLEGKARAVVGILCTDEQAANADRNALSNYAQAILRAGGSPRFIYMTRGTPKGQLSRSDALLIPGGIDVHPSKYGESLGPGMSRSTTNPDFDDMEIAFIQEGWRIGMPMLGICRGMQIMNVAGGGTLVQDIPSEWKGANGVKINHNPPGGMMSSVHSVGINSESRLHRILGVSEMRVNSVHHQCVGKLSDQFDVTAVAFDGVVEGLQRKENPLQHGVQFHPEFARAANPAMARLLDDLIRNGERLKGTYYTTRA